MIRRRRRRVREVAFSFDSFLDVVANVVGIIIRLILVVWVGARSYSSIQTLPQAPVPESRLARAALDEEDPLQQELARQRRELALAQARLLEQLRQLQWVQESHRQAEGEITALGPRYQELEQAHATLDRVLAEKGSATTARALSLRELQQRRQRLAEEIRALEQLPPLKQTLCYRTPISRPVHAEELHFECREGRVTFIDLVSLLAEVRRGLDDKVKLLRTQWRVSDMAGPVGPFRLRYTIERQRGPLDAVFNGAIPETNSDFRYGLSEWTVEPLAAVRGEIAAAALAEGSEFRQVIDSVEPRQAVVTFWIYPDSFAVYRQLRDFLYDRETTVAGRPLADGIPISGSRHGSASRGQ